MNVGWALSDAVRRSAAPLVSAAARAWTSMSNRISVWSQTKPTGTTRNARAPAAASSTHEIADVGTDPGFGRASGALVRQVIARDADQRRDSPRGLGDLSAYGSPSWMTRDGRLWAVNTIVSPSRGRPPGCVRRRLRAIADAGGTTRRARGAIVGQRRLGGVEILGDAQGGELRRQGNANHARDALRREPGDRVADEGRPVAHADRHRHPGPEPLPQGVGLVEA